MEWDEQQLRQFSFSIVKVAPDPVRGETLNVGVVVVSASGEGRLQWTPHFKTRARALQRGFSFEAIERAIASLEKRFQVDPWRPALWEPIQVKVKADTLVALSERMNNQLQVSAPLHYQAESIDAAVASLFRRYVSRRPAPQKVRRLTHAQLKERIWQVVKDWADQPDVHILQPGFIEGKTAKHPVDIVIANGTPRAALFAVPVHQDELHLAYLYRDSLPTIAEDMQGTLQPTGHGFRVYAILPDPGQIETESERQFADETRALLNRENGVSAVPLAQLASVREQVIPALFHNG